MCVCFSFDKPLLKFFICDFVLLCDYKLSAAFIYGT